MKISLITIVVALAAVVIGSCAARQTNNETGDVKKQDKDEILSMRKYYTDEEITQNGWQKATFGGGCFWCTEAIFEEVKGVKSVLSGYAGGSMKNPTYSAVCTDTTGHAECVQIIFDPNECSYLTLLDVHMKTHDPTTPNRQGNDVGIQYRSVVFYANLDQKATTDTYIQKLNESKYYSNAAVTEVVPLETFWPAETYHQDYFAKNPDESYCIYVVAKKVDKFEHLFPELVKPEYK